MKLDYLTTFEVILFSLALGIIVWVSTYAIIRTFVTALLS